MQVTFEDVWDGTDRVPTPAALAEVLQTIESATGSDRQVAVRHPTAESTTSRPRDSPFLLDALTPHPLVESVALAWDAVARTPLPGVRSLSALPPYGCDESTPSNQPNLEQVVLSGVLP